MKILLVGINSKFIHSNPALYYLKNYVVSKAEDKACIQNTVFISEYTINQEKQNIVRSIYEQKADVVAFSCYIWNISYVRSIIKSLHLIAPNVDIWLGGPEVSFDPDERLKELPFLRGIMVGEGEESFRKLVNVYLASENAKQFVTPSKSYETTDELPRILYPAEELNFDDVPFPYDDLSLFSNKIVYYETSRGCPFGCAYCLSSVDRKVRLRSIELVKKELQTFLDARIPLVKFVDRTFNCNESHTLEILRYIKEHDNDVTCFHFEIAAELITKDEMKILSELRKGQVQLEIGVQSTNEKALLSVNRKSNKDKLFEITKELISYGNMHIHTDLIAGLPYEDLFSFKNSFNEVYSLHSNDLQLGFLKVLKGSPIEKMKEKYGLVYNDEPPYEILSTNFLSFDDVTELKGVCEMLEVYYNSGQFINTMRFLEEKFETPYEIYKKINDFYINRGYAGISHDRYSRYEILREFACSCDLDIDAVTERLLLDLYLRDNVKSRPAFGALGVIEKKDYHDFFESGRYKRYVQGYDDFSPAQVSKMIHIEKTRDGFILFDYKDRDRITGNAKTSCISKEEFFGKK